MRLVVDPSCDDLMRLLADAPDGDVRALRAPDGRVYAWAAHTARHVEVATSLDLPFANRAKLQAASHRFSRADVEAVGAFADFADLVQRLARRA